MAEQTLPTEFEERLFRFFDYLKDELGMGLLWVEGLRALLAPDGLRLDLSKTGVSELGRKGLEPWGAREFAAGVPRFAAHSVVSYWSAVEALVEDLFVLRIQLNPAYLEGELAKTKMPLADVVKLERDELIRLIAATVGRKGSALGSFEALLGYVELSGPVAEGVRRDLRELEQVRNVIVHRNGVVDRRLADVAYKLDVELGKDLRLTEDDSVRYYGACEAYGYTLLARLNARYRGEPYPPETVENEEIEPGAAFQAGSVQEDAFQGPAGEDD